MKTITPVEFQKLLTDKPDLAVLDVRTPVEFASVHVTQARNIPLDKLNPAALYEKGELPKGQPVYFLCQSGGRATKASEQFARAGHDYGVVVEGGTLACTSAGVPVVRGIAKTISLERQVRIGAGSLVLSGVLLSLFVHPYFIGLSGFVGTGLIFAGITDWCGMGLLLAKMPWNSRA